MKNNIRIASAVIFLSAFIMLVSFDEQKAEWKGTIEKVDGIKVIKNPKEPLYGEITYELEEDLSIGNEEDENYMFYRTVRIAVDSEENILVLDSGNCRIQKYDKTGNYLQTMGGKGQGPGEFEDPWGIHLDSEDNIYVGDSQRHNINVFGKRGDFKRVIRLPSYTFNFGATKEKNVLMIYTSRLPEKPREGENSLVLVNPEGKIIQTIASYPYLLPPMIKRRMLGNPYSHRLYFFPAKNGGGIYGHSSEYKLFGLNSSGNLSYIIEIDRPPDPVTNKDKNRRIDEYLERQRPTARGEKLSRSEVKRAYIFPEFKPFFQQIIGDDEGRIYVRRSKLYNPDDISQYYDFFSKEGHYLYKIKIPFFTNTIKRGYVYSVKSDPDTGYLKIIRYKIKNWEQIKKREFPISF